MVLIVGCGSSECEHPAFGDASQGMVVHPCRGDAIAGDDIGPIGLAAVFGRLEVVARGEDRHFSVNIGIVCVEVVEPAVANGLGSSASRDEACHQRPLAGLSGLLGANEEAVELVALESCKGEAGLDGGVDIGIAFGSGVGDESFIETHRPGRSASVLKPAE